MARVKRGVTAHKRHKRLLKAAEGRRGTRSKLIKPAQKTFWGGYAGYFQDPDDHLWEIIYNPAFLPEE